MTKFTVVESATGRVLFSGEAAEPASLAEAGQTVLLGTVYEGGYVLEGDHLLEGAKPSQYHSFDWDTKQWVDPRTLQDHKDAKWLQIKSAREGAFNSPLTTPYGVFDSDPVSRSRISDAVLLTQTLIGLGLPADTDFTLADNTSVTLLPADMVTVGLLLGQKIQAAFAQARNLRTQIYAVSNATELEAIQWIPLM